MVAHPYHSILPHVNLNVCDISLSNEMTISSMLVIFTVITQDMLLIKIFISHAQEPTLENSLYLQL